MEIRVEVNTLHFLSKKLIKSQLWSLLVLLAILSDNYLKQAQNDTVVVQQEEMDRVGVEPTTSASLR
jgi:hypothetical protein